MIALPLILFSIVLQDVIEPNREVQASQILGARSAQIQRALPVLNQVVLVPDEATYLDEISRWTPKARWPVLFEQEPFTSQFIRRFEPEKIWRRESVGKLDKKNLGKQMQHVIASAWGGTESVEEALHDIGIPPLGVVFTSINDSARTGAVALAAGRGQLLKYMSGKWGTTNEILDNTKTASLLQEIDVILSSTGADYAEIGDTIDAITICQTLPARVTFDSARQNPVAVSDVIGRHASGKRFAWTGWLFGSKSRSSYIAMCSLFLSRDRYWLCNTYPSKGEWGKYGFALVAEPLELNQIIVGGIEGTLASLQQACKGGVTTDAVFFTSKGNQDFLEMSDARTSPTWLPILNTPSVLYFVHSWSLKNPGAYTTVGGTWLARGVYAYVGSSHEPMLSAFVPPADVMHRTIAGGIPFLPASRKYSGEGVFASAWRVNTIGDPLMLCGAKSTVTRLIKPADSRSDYQDVIKHADAVTITAERNPSDATFASAIHEQLVIGCDDAAVTLWIDAMDHSIVGPKSAKAALPVLFREKQSDSFIWAYRLLDSPTRPEKDMLWQLLGTSKTTPLQLLVQNLRRPYSLDDLTIIASRIIKAGGVTTLRTIIEEKLKKAIGRNKRGLERLRKKHGG